MALNRAHVIDIGSGERLAWAPHRCSGLENWPAVPWAVSRNGAVTIPADDLPVPNPLLVEDSL